MNNKVLWYHVGKKDKFHNFGIIHRDRMKIHTRHATIANFSKIYESSWLHWPLLANINLKNSFILCSGGSGQNFKTADLYTAKERKFTQHAVLVHF